MLIYTTSHAVDAENLRKGNHRLLLEQVLCNYDLKFTTAVDEDSDGIEILPT